MVILPFIQDAIVWALVLSALVFAQEVHADQARVEVGKNQTTTVVGHLLAKENYLLGVGGRESVRWIRVTGSRESEAEVVTGALEVPARFGERTFADESAQDARRAQRLVAVRLESSSSWMRCSTNSGSSAAGRHGSSGPC